VAWGKSKLFMMAENMKFVKLQASGNDFVLIDACSRQRDWAALARSICHRHLGVGADGLLLLLDSKRADSRMRIFNSDGSEAEACGNGLRCFAKYLFDKKVVRKKEMTIETLAGVRKAIVLNAAERSGLIKVSMGQPELEASSIPLSREQGVARLLDITPIIDYPLHVAGSDLHLTFVSMGNPHAVCFVSQSVDDFPLLEIGPKVEYHPLFPQRANFEIVNIINRGHARARVWERGVGETLACGSGACAIAVAARLRGYIDDHVEIALPGGGLGVDWDGQGEVLLTGPAEMVFTGDWPEEDLL
jgi:diaminopimelate epimerase